MNRKKLSFDDREVDVVISFLIVPKPRLSILLIEYQICPTYWNVLKDKKYLTFIKHHPMIRSY